MALFAAAAAPAQEPAPASLPGTPLSVGYAIEGPYAFLRADGRVTGEAPEIAKRLAPRLGYDLRWVQTRFEALIPELEAGRFDLIAAGMFITPERARRVAFSQPTFRARQALLVRAGNPLELHSYEDALARPARIAVIAGSVEERVLRALGVAEARLVATPDAPVGRAALEVGLVDGLALSAPSARWMARRDELGRIEIAVPFSHPEAPAAPSVAYGAFAFRLGDQRLLRAWNEALEAFLGSAEHRVLAMEFGFTEEEMPDRKSVMDVLAE